MREFTATCVDMKTRMTMVLSECSYNKACDWLERHGFTTYDKFEAWMGMVVMQFSKPAEKIFVYDEERGYLLSN